MKLKFFRLALFLPCLVLLLRPLRADDALRERFLSEAPRAWQAYLNSLDQLEYTESSTAHSYDGSISIKTETSVALDFPFIMRTTREEFNGELSEKLHAANSEYTFTLEPSQDADGKQALVDVKKNKDAKNRTRQFPRLDVNARRNPILDLPLENRAALSAAFALELDDQYFLPSLVSAEEFEIIEILESQEDGQNVVKIEYRYEPEGVVGVVGAPVLQSGTLLLLPDSSWVIKKATFSILEGSERKDKTIIETSFDYEALPSDRPLPSKIRCVTSDAKNKTAFGESVDEYAWNLNPKKRDKKEFYLSYYGLPEPEFSDSFRWIRPVLIMFGLILLFAALRFLHKMNESKGINRGDANFHIE